MFDNPDSITTVKLALRSHPTNHLNKIHACAFKINIQKKISINKLFYFFQTQTL
jgi:hypothetical protein